ncbi:MAG TPA: murein L,D-transpeptidase catalytic domain family protein [Spongiibacteraceae bacterium]|nr:murein L,D-transpeptidase catalytic domain family protein [Spongiibacteraceae bacterium]
MLLVALLPLAADAKNLSHATMTRAAHTASEVLRVSDDSSRLSSALRRAAPNINAKVLDLALTAMHCATAHGMSASQRLAVIDYSLPSTEPRLWVFDLQRQKLLYRELVAHGRNSGENYAHDFSNVDGSRKSSLGLFRTLDTYNGSNGYSLRMDGLETGFNDNALERAIVMHGAPYVDKNLVRTQGRVGRSWGCPAVRKGIARQMIDSLKGGQFVFSYYPDPHWLTASRYLHCDADRLALN